MDTVQVSEVFCRSAEIFMEKPPYDQQESVEINPEKYLNPQMTTHCCCTCGVCVLSVVLSCILPQLKYFTTQSEKQWEKGQNTWKLAATEEQISSQIVYPRLLLLKVSVKKSNKQTFPPMSTLICHYLWREYLFWQIKQVHYSRTL